MLSLRACETATGAHGDLLAVIEKDEGGVGAGELSGGHGC